jgi:RNA polymerase sigma factor (sigma-70 family)
MTTATMTTRRPARARKARRDRSRQPDRAARGRGGAREAIRYVHHPSFSLPGAGDRLWGPGREDIRVAPFSLPREVEDGADAPRAKRTALTRDQERTLFLRYNYAKYRLTKLAAAKTTPPRRAQRALWRDRARSVREKILHANLPLVPAMAKRKHVEGVEFADKVSEGYMAMLRSVEHFDVSRGFKFSTYACRSILAALYRLGSKAKTYQKHVPFHFEPGFERDDHAERRHQQQRQDAIESVRRVLRRNDAALSEVQEQVIRQRYPVEARRPPRPLWKIGRALGLSTERIRQIEKASLEKLAEALDE